MNRKLTVLFAALTPGQRSEIGDAAGALGFQCFFADDETSVLSAAPDTEVFLGVSASLPARLPNLLWVSSPNAGAEPYCTPGVLPGHVLLTNSAGAYGVTIAEHIVMMSLELLRQRERYLRIVAARDWTRDLTVRSLYGSRILLLGTGDIGREAARRLRVFCPERIVGLNRGGRGDASLFDEIAVIDRIDEYLPETDLLIASLPGTPQTTGLLGRERLGMLPRHACIVNVGRGSLIDEEALRSMLDRGLLGGAALDVFREEPLPADSPLWETERLLITPHIAGNTTLPYTVERIVDLFLENLRLYASGQPLHRLVDRSLGY